MPRSSRSHLLSGVSARSAALASACVAVAVVLAACSGSPGVGIPEADITGVQPGEGGTPTDPRDPDSSTVTFDDPDSSPPLGDAGPDGAKPPIKDAGPDVSVDASDGGDGGDGGDAGDAGVSPVCGACLVKDCKAPYDACMNDAMCRVLSACLDACATSACRSACFVKYPDPAAKVKNGALYNCKCNDACAVACTNDCR